MLAHLGRGHDAARLMGLAVHDWTAHFGPLSNADRFELRRVQRLAAAGIGREAAAAAYADGARMSLADAVALLRRG